LWLAHYGRVIMARKPRVHFTGALYHVMSRGNQGQAIFKDDQDRERYLGFLKEGQKRFGYRLYAYVLMLGKLAEELASKPELRGVVETLCDNLRKGRRLKRSIRFA